MNTYKIRTQRALPATLVFLVLLLSGSFLLRAYSIEDVTGPDDNYILGAVIILIYLFVYFIFSEVQQITVSDEGVTAKWFKGSFGIKTHLKTIKWENIDYCQWSKGVRVKTKDKELYRLECMAGVLQKNFKGFYNDFNARYEDACEKGLTGTKPVKRIHYNVDEPWK